MLLAPADTISILDESAKSDRALPNTNQQSFAPVEHAGVGLELLKAPENTKSEGRRAMTLITRYRMSSSDYAS